jgi:uncharacterized protein YegJ (DUF2314 family)
MIYKLGNGEDLNRENPDTFYIPTREERESIKEGDTVKLMFIFEDENAMTERMWVQVVSKAGNQYKGFLDNVPYSTDSIKAGDEVIFSPEHIIQIYS